MYSLTKHNNTGKNNNMFLQAELEKETKVLQFDACCKAIVQNFDCGCGSLHSQKKLRVLTEKENCAIQKIWKYWLKEEPLSNENHIAWATFI